MKLFFSKLIQSLPIFFLLILGFIGCAPDRSLDDYKREKLREYLGQYQAAAGVFRGIGYSKIDHHSIGAVELILTAKIKSLDGSSGSKTDGAPVLKGKINLYGIYTASLDANDGFYDPDTGIYQANIPIKQQNGKTTEISITGKITQSQFEGSLEVTGFSEYGSNMTLARDRELPANDEQKITAPGQGSNYSNVLGSYIGTTHFRSGATRSVSLVIFSTRNSSEEDFLNLFNPVKTVQVTLNYDESMQISHSIVEWNQQTHRMIGTSSVTVNNKSVTLALDCNQTLATDLNGWDCQTSTTTSGWIARTEVIPSLPDKTSKPQEPGNTNAILMQYEGEATLLDGTKTPVKMSALFPPRSRDTELAELFFPPAERQLTVTVLFPVSGSAHGSFVPVTFDASHWDLKTHILNGVTSSSSPGTGITLTCQNFEFNEGDNPFDCLFIPNRWGAPISIHFEKKKLTRL